MHGKLRHMKLLYWAWLVLRSSARYVTPLSIRAAAAMGSRSCNHPCLWLWAVANVAILFIVASISDAQQPVPTCELCGAK